MPFLKTNYKTKNQGADGTSNLFANNKDLSDRVNARGSIVIINAPVCPVVGEETLK